MLDLLIRNGLVIDGSGNPGYHATVGVEGDVLRILRGDASALPAARTIDASGHVVAPGFIDMHSHAGLTILGEPRHEPKVRQGVTTELIGIDGNSHAPFKTREDLHRYIELDSGLNGEPPMPADWLTVAGQLSMFDNRVAVNICFILGNSPVRIWAVGWDDRPATRAELDDMKSVVREVCEEGSFGLSTGLDYPPGSYADTNELIELSKVVARTGGFYHTHTRALLRQTGLLAPWQEALEIGRASDIAVHFTHYRQRSQGDGSHLDYLGLVEQSRDQGLDVTFDCYPYVYGSTRANIWLPGWTMDGGPERLAVILDSPKERARLRQEMQARNALGRTDEGWLTNFRKPENLGYEGRSILDISRERGQDPLDAFLDLMRSEGHSLCAIMIGTNPQTLPAFVSHPCGMVGSDAILLGEYPSPRTYGCFPVILAEFVRAEKHLQLPEAIRKMTSFPAQRLGLRDRGLLRDGMKADVTIFDPNTVKATATPRQPKQFPLGIPYVIVNGKIVVDKGEHTGALPGRALRYGR
jgi:N-acyl-D-amino-acid deacylase